MDITFTILLGTDVNHVTMSTMLGEELKHVLDPGGYRGYTEDF